MNDIPPSGDSDPRSDLRSEVRRLRRWCGDPRRAVVIPPRDDSRRVEQVIKDLEPIRSRSSLAASYEREAARTEAIRLAYTLRWVELGRGVSATGISRSRRRRVTGLAVG